MKMVMLSLFRITGGHGLSVNEKYPYGYMNGIDEIIDDQYMVSQYIKRLYPSEKIYLIPNALIE